MMQVSLIVRIVGCPRGGAAEVVILATMESRLLGVTFLQVREVLIIDGSQGWVVNQTVASKVVVLLSVLK